MLNIDLEYKRGILFVRFSGPLDKTTLKDTSMIDNIIKRAGIKYLFINFEKCLVINYDLVSCMLKKYKDLIGDDGRLLACGLYNKNNLEVNISDFEEIDWQVKEVNAFSIINI